MKHDAKGLSSVETDINPWDARIICQHLAGQRRMSPKQMESSAIITPRSRLKKIGWNEGDDLSCRFSISMENSQLRSRRY